jgi:mono/diheme cytochrome c family protein
LPELGVTLVGSTYVQSKTEAELVEFLKVGRLPGQPGSVRNGVMPGFGYLLEAELQALAAYLRDDPRDRDQ